MRGEINRIRVVLRDGVATRVKRCVDCGEDKVCADDPEVSDYHAMKRWPDGSVRYFLPRCKPCHAEYQRDWRARQALDETALEARRASARRRHAERMKTDPEYRENRRRLNARSQHEFLKDPTNRAQHREWTRNSKRRRRARERERVNEENRMYYALRQERKGRTVHRRRGWVGAARAHVPAGPFIEWLERYCKVRDVDPEALVSELGISRVHHYLRGQSMVSIDVVDRALQRSTETIAIGRRLILSIEDLYDEGTLVGATSRIRRRAA